MTANMFKHGGKCGGLIVMDASNRFYFSTPSFYLSPDGITLGTMEISENRESTEPRIKCQKCGESPNLLDEKSVTAQCMFCRRYKYVGDLWTAYPFSCICTSCKGILSGETETKNEELLEVMSYYLVPKNSVIFVPLLDLLRKPIK